MNHACECGHQPSDHYLDTGQCEYMHPDDDFPCTCNRYEWQGDN